MSIMCTYMVCTRTYMFIQVHQSTQLYTTCTCMLVQINICTHMYVHGIYRCVMLCTCINMYVCVQQMYRHKHQYKLCMYSIHAEFKHAYTSIFLITTDAIRPWEST